MSLNPAWETASRERLLEELEFQGSLVKELTIKNDRYIKGLLNMEKIVNSLIRGFAPPSVHISEEEYLDGWRNAT